MDNAFIKVLLIEDNPDDACFVEEMLAEVEETTAEFELAHAERLSIGLKHLARGGIDALLLDLSLPDSHGLDTFATVNAQAPDIPIIVLSGLDDVSLAVEAMREGAQDYLVKGRVDSSLLVRAIHYAVERKRADEAMRTSETHYRAIIERSADGVIIVDGNGIVRFVNPMMEALFGREAKELLGKPFGHSVRPGEVVELDFIRGVEHRLSTTVEMRVVETEWAGEMAYLASLRDITEHKRAEEALRYRSEFENLITTTSTLFIYLAPDEIDSGIDIALQEIGELTGVDRCYIFLFSNDGTKMNNTHEWCAPGIEPQIDNLQGLPVETLPWWMKKLNRFEAIHIPRVADLPPRASAEKEILQAQAIQSLIVVPMVQGRSLVGFLGFDSIQAERIWPDDIIALFRLVGELFANVLERKRTETELNAYHEHLETLVQERTAKLNQAMAETAIARDEMDAILCSVVDGLIVTDLERKVILVNPVAEALLGFRQEELLGQEIGATIKDEQLREVVRDTLAQHTSDYEIDVELEGPGDGRRTTLRVCTVPVNDPQGKLLGMVTVIRDVTRLCEADRIKTEFLSMAAHELRTPLTSIQGFSEILLARHLDETRQGHYLAMINKQATHLTEIVNDLLDSLRLEAGHSLEIKSEPVDMARLMIEEVLPLFIETASQHHIQVEGLEKLPLVVGDSFRLAQVGKNLLSNAIKFSPQGGAITIRGRTAPDYLEISVQDEGIGMTAEQQAHLFEKFYRADGSDTAIGGTGLGLVISKLIVEEHGGKIWLESQPGVGTTVYFTLPLVEDKL